MRINKPVILVIPLSLVQKLNKYLKTNPPKFKYDINCFYYVVHHIITRYIRKYKKQEYIYINFKKLSSVIGVNTRVYVKILENGQFIKHKKGEGYKLNINWINGIERIEINKGCKLFDKIVAHNRTYRKHDYRKLEPFLLQVRDFLLKMEMDYQKAEQWIKNNSKGVKQYCYYVALENMRDQRFRYFKRNPTNNRLDTNHANLKNEILAKLLIGDNVSIDMVNSAPFLFNSIIKLIKEEETESKQQGRAEDKKNNPLCSKKRYPELEETFGKFYKIKILIIDNP